MRHGTARVAALLGAWWLAAAAEPAPAGEEAPAAITEKSAAPGAGEERPKGPEERVVVRGDADGSGPLDPTAFATVIRAEDFAGRVTTLPELLRATVGLQVKSLGGEFATVSIRGSSAEQVVIYLDGVPLNRALGGGVNLADLPLPQVESVEIYRGVTPASLPAASIGGAIVIHTRRPAGRRSGSASGEFGSFATGAASASLTHAGERAGVSIGADAAQSRADFPYLDNNGTRNEGRDDEVTRRRNNDFARLHLTGRSSIRAGRARVDLSADLLRRDQGVPGVDSYTSETARFDSRRALLRAGVEAPGLAGGRLLLRGAADYTRHAEGFLNPDGDLGLTRQETDNVIGSLGQEAGLVLVAGRTQAISILAARRRETADLRSDLLDGSRATDVGVASRRTAVLAIEDQVALAGGRLVLNPSLRHERWEDRFRPGEGAGVTSPPSRSKGEETTGKVGLRLVLGEGVSLKANTGRYLRLPDFIERFGYSGAVLGNRALQPERGRTLDVGLAATLWKAERGPREARVEITLFETRAEDLILLVPNAQASVIARNIGRARVRGAELSLWLAPTPRFSAGLNATRQRAVDTSGTFTDGYLLPGRPRDELSADAGLDLGRGRLHYAFTYVGPNFINGVNTESWRLPARYLHDLGYRFRLPQGLQAVVEVKNLSDQRAYDVARYPLPDRSIHGRLTWEF